MRINRPALKIAGIFFVIAICWAIVAYQAILIFAPDPIVISWVARWENIALLLLIASACIVYLLSKKYHANKLLMAREASGGTGVSGFILAFVTLAGVILLVGLVTVQHTASKQRSGEIERLHAIGDLKVAQIVTWFGERQSDGQLIANDASLADAYEEWILTKSAVARRRVEERLHIHRTLKDYQELAVIGSNGEQITTSNGASALSDINQLSEAMKEARNKGKLVTTGLYRVDKRASSNVFLDFIVPLRLNSGSREVLVVLRIDPNQFLFPFIQSWPIPSASAETLLFRRDGDAVLFLNELRHRSNTALTLRLPSQGNDLLAAQVSRGSAKPGEPVDGSDYRGIKVLGVVKTIPGTSWYLVAKLDKWELYAATKRYAAWIALTHVLALIIAAVAAVVLYQRAELRHAETQHREQTEKIRALQLLDAICEGTTDAIYAKNTHGRYILVNREFCRLFGKTRQEFLENGDSRIFPPADAERITSDDRKTIEGCQIWSVEDSLPTIGGRRSFRLTRGPLYSLDGRIMGLFGICRDITESKFQDRQMRAAEARCRAILDAVNEGILLHDVDNRIILEANLRISEMFGYSREELRRLPIEKMMGDSAPYPRSAFAQWLERANGGESLDFEWQGQHKNGHFFPLRISMHLANVAGRLGVLLLMHTARGQPPGKHESI